MGKIEEVSCRQRFIDDSCDINASSLTLIQNFRVLMNLISE
jgi:hypothetical protein